jgi:purine-nucleoside phosphorylase
MSTHIGAAPGEVAGTVLIAGDPLRARYVAEHMLDDVVCYNEVRGMLGFTGYYAGKRVSVQGTGIGIPSTAIYVHELIHDFGVERIIRIGTCGALQPGIPLDQLVIASAAYTDSATHLLFYPDRHVPAVAPGRLLEHTRAVAGQLDIPVLDGPIFSTDMFYSDDEDRWRGWQQQGLLAVEMETSMLYALAMRNGIEALTILSVSDNIVTQEAQTAADRESANVNMMRLALEVA